MNDYIYRQKLERANKRALVYKMAFIGSLLAFAMTLDYNYTQEGESKDLGCITDSQCEGVDLMPEDTPTEELDCDDNQCTPEQEKRWDNFMFPDEQKYDVHPVNKQLGDWSQFEPPTDNPRPDLRTTEYA